MIEVCSAFVLMLAGHFVADYILQPSFLVRAKRNEDFLEQWRALFLHGSCHGFFVMLATGLPALGLAEAFLHAAVDGMKCQKWFGNKTDQFLHLLCKLVWAAALI